MIEGGKSNMKKIAIIGCGGSGKSTLARQLSERLELEVIHLDQLFWSAGWVMADKEEQKIIHEQLNHKSSWIIDGNYSSTWDQRLDAADTVIFLDFSRYLCIYRIFKRFLKHRKQTRPDMADGCEEQLDFDFLKWIWNYHNTNRPGTLAKIKSLPSDKRVIVLQKPKEVVRFLREIEV